MSFIWIIFKFFNELKVLFICHPMRSNSWWCLLLIDKSKNISSQLLSHCSRRLEMVYDKYIVCPDWGFPVVEPHLHSSLYWQRIKTVHDRIFSNLLTCFVSSLISPGHFWTLSVFKCLCLSVSACSVEFGCCFVIQWVDMTQTDVLIWKAINHVPMSTVCFRATPSAVCLTAGYIFPEHLSESVRRLTATLKEGWRSLFWRSIWSRNI